MRCQGLIHRSRISYPAPEIPYQEAVIRAEGKLKIAFAPDLGGFGQVDPEMAQHLAAAMRQLEKNGARIEETCPDLAHLERSYHTLRGLMWATAAKRLPPGGPSAFQIYAG